MPTEKSSSPPSAAARMLRVTGRRSHDIWINVTARLSSLVLRFSSCLSHSSHIKAQTRFELIPRCPFLLQLIQLCQRHIVLILSLCSFSASSESSFWKSTQQITNWYSAGGAALCFMLAAQVSLNHKHARCWRQNRSWGLGMNYTWVWVKEAGKKKVKLGEKWGQVS